MRSDAVGTAIGTYLIAVPSADESVEELPHVPESIAVWSENEGVVPANSDTHH